MSIKLRGESPPAQKTGVGQLFDWKREAKEPAKGSLEDEGCLSNAGQLA